ncbi:proteinase inhibitor I4 [Dactylonectria estremocensis]|uniref:Proteinase inhibitor I4 n=1 Tax=Dactylonectria estremocensis TaxID=1079267 RepID=A0A9P9FDT4_9HYPO|nr:proteinase inhibitor I4 [Dactylonectria estremocensis]
MSSIAQATHVLGWDILERLCVADASVKGICISPLSIATALAMLAGAAGGDRRDELCRKIGVDSLPDLSDSFKALGIVFGTKAQDQMVTMANVAFAECDVDFYPAYTQFLDSFGAHVLKFPSLQEATGDINAWISDNTRGLIKDMLSRDDLDQVHVALINALAFKGTWKTKFDRKLTQKNTPFFVTETETRKVHMMFIHKEKIATVKRPGYTAVRLPYAAASSSASMSLVAYLPDKGTSLKQLVQSMDRSRPPLPVRAKKYDKFGFPKFNLDTSLSILPMLLELGFPVAGGFSEMAPGRNEVQSCIHRAVIKVDEEGTEAVAATAVLMKRRSRVPDLEIMVFDRPFAFSICLDESNAVVFTGLFFGR